MNCIHPGCGAETGSNRLKRCVPHRFENEQQKIKEANERGQLKRLAKRAENPLPCKDCGNPTVGKSKRCQPCKDAARTNRHKIYPNYHLAKDGRTLGAEKPPKPIPRKAPAKLMTDAEQRRIDKEVSDRINRDRGYGHGDVIRYTAAEIAEMSRHVTPIHLTPGRHFAAGCEIWRG